MNARVTHPIKRWGRIDANVPTRTVRLHPQTGPKGITDAMLKRALKKHLGVFVLAARELGCERSNIDQRVKRSPELQQFLADLDEEISDVADGVIKESLLKKDKLMTRWYAERKMKNRGYVLRQELTGRDGVPLPAASVSVTVMYVEPPKKEEDR